MKNLKKIFSAILVLVLSLVSLNVFAEESYPGIINVNNTVNGKEYDVYKIFDLTYNGSKVAYTIDSRWVDFFFGDNALGKDYIVSTNSGGLNKITHDNKTYYINITGTNVAEVATKALEYASKTAAVTAEQTKTATGTTLQFTNLKLGYYLVYPQGATKIEDTYASIASLDSTVPTANVNVKSSYPVITKNVDRNSFDVGEEALFTINGTVPDMTGFTSYNYDIYDSWTSGLSAINGTVKDLTVKINGADATYTIEYPTANSFKLSITNMIGYTAGNDIVITYKLLVTKDAINSNDTNNEAYLKYSSNPKNMSDYGETAHHKKYVYSSKIEVTKIDGDSNEELADATFVLMKGNKYYNVDANGNVTWVDDLNNQDPTLCATKYTTQADGIITFAGIMDGDYKLVEVEAPAGYNKLPQPVDVSVNGTTINQQTGVPTSNATTQIIANYTGVELPSTGGFGTKLFIIIGSLLAMISSVVLVTNKRMAKEEM